MKVLIFCPYYPPHIGGLESHSDEFNKYVSRHDTKITVFTPRLPTHALKNETLYSGGVTLVRFPAFEAVHNYPLPKFWQRHFWQEWHSLFQDDYDIVVSRTRFFFTSLMAWRYARKRGIPWVHIEHGSDFASFNSPLKTALGKLYDRTIGTLVLRHSTKNIANSVASAHFVELLSGQKNTAVIYRGIERERLSQTQPENSIRETYQDKVILGFIGRLIDGKGVADLLTALSLVKRNNFICLIIGDGPEKERLVGIVSEKRLEDKVVFFGYKSFPEAMALLKVFDIFINPSYTEGIPTSVIEAAFCKKAIIATHVGGTQEIITGKNDGFLITPKDIAGLTSKIETLIDSKGLREELGTNAFLAVEHKFDWNSAAEQYTAVFTSLKK